MRVIIAGGRSYGLKTKFVGNGWRFGSIDEAILNSLNVKMKFSLLLCGMASGADACGWTWAHDKGILIKEYPADWDEYGKAAGPMRNAEMAKNADCLICFSGGSGTESMMNLAIKHGLKIIDLR